MSCFGFLWICFTHTHILCHHSKKQNQNFSKRVNTSETEHIAFSQDAEKFMKRGTGTHRFFACKMPQQGRYAVCFSPQTAQEPRGISPNRHCCSGQEAVGLLPYVHLPLCSGKKKTPLDLPNTRDEPTMKMMAI